MTTKAPIWLLVLITLSGTLAMHLFVPALPDAGRDFGAGTAVMQTTISAYIVGLAVGQLIYGPLSDGLGRRPMLMVGLAIYTSAGVVAALSTSVQALIVARLFQALGGCAGLALGRAIVRDTARPDEAVRDLALLNFMSMVATWRLPPQTNRPNGNIKATAIAADYLQLLRSPSFMGFALGGACATTSICAFLSAAPFVIPSQLHRPLHEVGFYLALLMTGISRWPASWRPCFSLRWGRGRQVRPPCQKRSAWTPHWWVRPRDCTDSCKWPSARCARSPSGLAMTRRWLRPVS